ncbi:tumor necrosis factor receptor superfamily member 1A [Biomphalaria glabrata]|nr:tumor necrosis factor receptor superfamily member 1A [Biomphalaria glabrata]
MLSIHIFFACCCLIVGSRPDFVCQKGQFVYFHYFGPPVCLECEPDTYMSEDNHTNINCSPCSRVNVHAFETLLKDCTATSDTVIGCIPGYYKTMDGAHGHVDLDCQRCKQCEGANSTVVRNCTETSDTVCCRLPGMFLEGDTHCSDHGEYVCQRGQFLDLNAPTGPKCLDCPPGTYSDKDNHRDTNCAPCTRPNAIEHEKVEFNCTSFSDSVIGCAEGFFRVVRHSLSYQDVDCLRCSNCEERQMYTARPCGETFDAVCCQRPGAMIQEIGEEGRGICLDEHTN